MNGRSEELEACDEMSENLPAKLNSMLAVNFDEMRIIYRRLDAAWKSIYKLEIPIS